MNIYELLNRFWLENEYDPCSATEIALYFFLLNKANTRRWKMPFRCSTELIRMQLSTTRQNVLKAREGLHKKGFISFTTGTSKGNYAQYSIIDCTTQFTVQTTDELTDKVTDAITGELTEPLPGRLPPHNIKDKEIYKSHNISMEKLESMLLEEREWHSSILTRLSTAIKPDKLTDYLKTFFAYQKKKGVKSRAVEDVKIHFQNWLSKKLENDKGYGNNEQKESDPRRGTEIQAASAEDYKHTI